LRYRVFLAFSTALFCLLAEYVAHTKLLPPFEYAGVSLGPVKIASEYLDLPAASPNISAWDQSGTASINVHWRSPVFQKNAGDVRVTAVWSGDTPQFPVKPAEVCRFLLSHYGKADGVRPRSLLPDETYSNHGHCYSRRSNDSNAADYEFMIAPPRCGMRALVFAFVSNNNDVPVEVLDSIDSIPAISCQAKMVTFSRVVSFVPLLFLVLIAMSSWRIWHRSLRT
jgi:hypothetical protein